MNRRVTIKDVARTAGVTHTTVSRVIHDDHRISTVTKERVRHALKMLDYQPNLVARGLVRNRTQVVALISPELDPFALPIVRGVAESASGRNYAMMLFPTNTWTEESLTFEQVAQNWRVDGILIYNLIYHDEITDTIRDLQSRNVPFVFINKYLSEPSVNAAGVDNYQAVGLVVDHLASLGHKRIGMLYGDLTSVDGTERLEGFKAALKKNGLPYIDSICACPFWHDDLAYKEMARIIDEAPEPPTAMFCANDLMAISAINAALDKKLRVPKDIAFVGFDDHEAGRRFHIPVSTVSPPLYDAGAGGFDLLMEIIDNPDREPVQVRLKAELIVRESSGKKR